jgi:6-phosphogluconolactonase
VIAVHDAPKPPAERVSLNFETLRACRQQLVIVTGSEKAGALAAWQQGQNLPIAQAVRTTPACCLMPRRRAQRISFRRSFDGSRSLLRTCRRA